MKIAPAKAAVPTINSDLPTLTCPECGEPMRLVVNPEYARPCAWRCSRYGCTGYHGAHDDGTPLGIPAPAATRQMRHEAHLVFDRLWRSGAMSRTQAYAELDAAMGVAHGEAHFGAMSLVECKRAIKWAEVRLEFLQSYGSKVPEYKRKIWDGKQRQSRRAQGVLVTKRW